MIFGLAAWNLPHRCDSDNIRFLAPYGFRSLSLLGMDFRKICFGNPDEAEKIASAVRDTGVILTVHDKIPATMHDENIDEFFMTMDCVAEWQKKYRLITNYTFDAPKERGEIYFVIKEIIDRYGDLGIRFGTEDFPLNTEDAKLIREFATNGQWYNLVDLGHMNLRLTALGDNSFDAYMRAIQAFPLKIIEMHVHNNFGVKDDHFATDNGTAPIKKVLGQLEAVGYDGVMTVETVPGWYDIVDEAADKLILDTFETTKKMIL